MIESNTALVNELKKRGIVDAAREFEVLVDLIGEEKRNQIIVGIKNRMFGEGVMLEKITFDDWIRHISEM